MSAATACGTGMLVEPPALPDPVPGLYVCRRPAGVVAHITASAHALHAVRGLAAMVLRAYGAAEEAVGTAQLVLSELVGNAVRACGPHVPLVVEVYLAATGATVAVHDPLPELLPRRSAAAMDDDQAECGRGLALLDILAPGWSVEASPVGKQIRCRIPT
ncbi:hypothetical protein GCM10027168_44430 [Streptomyces capparidis]